MGQGRDPLRIDFVRESTLAQLEKKKPDFNEGISTRRNQASQFIAMRMDTLWRTCHLLLVILQHAVLGSGSEENWRVGDPLKLIGLDQARAGFIHRLLQGNTYRAFDGVAADY